MGACFMAACLTGISNRLIELDIEIDIRDVFTSAGFAVFQMYPDEEQARIISAGGNAFKKLVGESSSRPNLQRWIEGVQAFTASYVLTGDKAWIPSSPSSIPRWQLHVSRREQPAAWARPERDYGQKQHTIRPYPSSSVGLLPCSQADQTRLLTGRFAGCERGP